ncbi:hypothetical protein DRO53_02195 [Candidatus Bathyarchaeota archaeon]|nr:MAG: hypothetical protein DRO53_02195 [Candidatus Bathyarchaeota archaeon]
MASSSHLQPEDITIIHEPLTHPYGQNMVALMLAEEFAGRGFRVRIVGQECSPEIEERLKARGITFVRIGHRRCLLDRSELKSFETWLRDCIFPYEGELHSEGVTVNTSSMLSLPSTLWYAQGPVSTCLSHVVREQPARYRLAYYLLKPIIQLAECEFINRIRRRVKVIVANSRYCASLYQRFGIRVGKVIYPPMDCKVFQPSTGSPTSDYVLTYFGKETLWSTIRTIADRGVKVKAFGGKVEDVPRSILEHPNIEYLGRVETWRLVELYSNALYTLFTYNHEPFGYIPVESMACGTPVLTLKGGGPAESVVDGRTGWLCENPVQLVEWALKIWREGYPGWIRMECRKRALSFDRRRIAEEWLQLLEGLYSS